LPGILVTNPMWWCGRRLQRRNVMMGRTKTWACRRSRHPLARQCPLVSPLPRCRIPRVRRDSKVRASRQHRPRPDS